MNDASDNFTPVTMSDIAEENLDPPELEGPEVYPIVPDGIEIDSIDSESRLEYDWRIEE